jgi:hypothetical protein
MKLPAELSKEAQARIITQKVDAAMDLEDARERLPETVNQPQAIAVLVQTYVLQVMAAFAHEVCELGLANVWTAVEIEERVVSFLTTLVRETLAEYGSDAFPVPAILSRMNGLILPEIWAGFRASKEWKGYQSELRLVAQHQSQPTDTAKKSTQSRRGYRNHIRRWMSKTELTSVRQAAKRLGVSESTLKSIMTDKGKIRHGDAALERVLKETRYKPEDR